MVLTYALIRQPGSLLPIGNLFRNYYAGDQLSYAAYAVNISNGDFSNSEPFTQTGSSFYPSAWYRFLGLLGQITGVSEAILWNFVGSILVLLTVAWIGFLAWRLTHIWWAPLTIGVLLGVGPIATALGGQWAATLSNGITLWGAYGALYTLNAEVIGLCLGISALGIVLITITKPPKHKGFAAASILVACAIIGLIANIHTYAFFLSITVFLGFGAALGIRSASTKRPLLLSLVILILVLSLGSTLRDYIGELPVFGLMLCTTLPGLWVLVRGHIRLGVLAGSILAIFAIPQFLITVNGILSNNEFLTYRVAQSANRGLSAWDFISVGSPILVLFIFNALTLRSVRAPYLKSALYSWFIAFLLLSFNNFWGFGQEPYRFWINGAFFGIAIMSITSPLAIRALSNSQTTNTYSKLAAIVSVLLVSMSLWNVGGFRTYVHEVGMINLESEQVKSMRALSSSVIGDRQLISSEPCLEPEILKLATGKPVAFYNRGMAWPEDKISIDAVIKNSDSGILDLPTLQRAGITHLYTDSSCETGWALSDSAEVTKLGEVEYQGAKGLAVMTLWGIN